MKNQYKVYENILLENTIFNWIILNFNPIGWYKAEVEEDRRTWNKVMPEMDNLDKKNICLRKDITKFKKTAPKINFTVQFLQLFKTLFHLVKLHSE